MKTIKTLFFVVVVARLGSLAYAAPKIEDFLRSFASETGQSQLVERTLLKDNFTAPQGQPASIDERRPAVVQDKDLEQTLHNIGMLQDPHERNQAIEKCFNVNNDRLSWKQTERILNAVSSTEFSYSHPYDRENVIQRIVAQFLQVHSKEIDVIVAVKATRWDLDHHEANKGIENYFNTERDRLGWPEVETLLRGIQATEFESSHDYDRSNSIERITREFLSLNATKLKASIATSVARWNSNPHVCNEEIEKYFYAVKTLLAQSDVEVLLNGIQPTEFSSSHTYDNESTKQRIVRAWGCPLCGF